MEAQESEANCSSSPLEDTLQKGEPLLIGMLLAECLFYAMCIQHCGIEYSEERLRGRVAFPELMAKGPDTCYCHTA